MEVRDASEGRRYTNCEGIGYETGKERSEEVVLDAVVPDHVACERGANAGDEFRVLSAGDGEQRTHFDR